MIQFTCSDCGLRCQAEDIHAGMKTRCPGCDSVVTIPAGMPEDGAIRAEPPPPRPALAVAETETLVDRPRRPLTHREPREIPWRLIGYAVLLLALVGGAWWYFTRKDGISSDFDLVPRDAQFFATVQVSALLETDLGKQAQAVFPFFLNRLPPEWREWEKLTGIRLADIDRVTVVLADADARHGWVVVRTSKEFRREGLLEALALAIDKSKPFVEKENNGKNYHSSGQNTIYFPDDHSVVFSNEESMDKLLNAKKRSKSGPLKDALRQASAADCHVAWALKLSGISEQLKAVARLADVAKPLREAEVVSFTAKVKEGLAFQGAANYASSSKAREAREALVELLETGKRELAQEKVRLARLKDPEVDRAIAVLEKLLNRLEPHQANRNVTLSLELSEDDLMQLWKSLTPAVQRVRESATRQQSQNQMGRVGLALRVHADANNGVLPAPAILDKQMKPLLSWRVAVLPYLGEQQLYNDIRKNEPWDSPHNRQFHNRMPAVYHLPDRAETPESGLTAFQLPTGPGTVYDGPNTPRFPQGFSDGTGQTILVVEARHMVNWMQPADLVFDAQMDKPLSRLGDPSGREPLVALADSRVLRLPRNLSSATFRAALTPAANDVLGPDWQR